jgi:hypothetical protein
MHRLIKGLIMNERIKELAEQVGAVQNVLAMGRHDGVLFTETELEKFAELVVRECGQWVNDNLGLLDEEALADLLKHFGVEE